jgi:hypothetical protein
MDSKAVQRRRRIAVDSKEGPTVCLAVNAVTVWMVDVDVVVIEMEGSGSSKLDFLEEIG